MPEYDRGGDQPTSDEGETTREAEDLSAAKLASLPLPTDSSPPSPHDLGTADPADPDDPQS